MKSDEASLLLLSLYLQQCEGKPYNEKSDMWALGCILYEMANLQKTFEGTNLPALVNKIMKVRNILCYFARNLQYGFFFYKGNN